MSQSQCSNHTFLDYFSQKQGDNYIAELSKIKEDYDVKWKDLLERSSPDVKNKINSFQSLFLAPDKISPKIESVPEDFDFPQHLEKVFNGLGMSIKDDLELIVKYRGFVTSLKDLWKGLDVQAVTVVDTSVQLMGNFESIVYPLFLRLAKFQACLAQHPEKNSKNETRSPQKMMCRLHHLAYSVILEISSLGKTGLETLGQSCEITKEALAAEGAKLGCQGRNAKNCILWAMKAVSAVLFYYFLRSISDGKEHGKSPHEAQVQEAAMSKSTSNMDKDLKNDTTRVPMSKESSMDRKHKERPRSKRRSPEQTMSKTESRRSPGRSPEKTMSKTESRRSPGRSPEKTMSKTESRRSPGRSPEKTMSKTESRQSPEKSRRSAERKKAVEIDSNAGGKRKVSDKESTANKAKSRQSMVDTKPKEFKNFIYYFYKKKGQHYVSQMKQLKGEYDGKSQEVLNAASSTTKTNAKQYAMKFKEAKKPSRPQENLGVQDVNFNETVSKIFNGLQDIDIKNDVTILCKYYKFTKHMVSHWNYRIQHQQPLDPDAVVEVSIQMMGTTAAVAYPIIIKMSEHVARIAANPKSAGKGLSPNAVTDALLEFIDIITTQMGAIGVSCLATIMKIPAANKDETSIRSERLAGETKHGFNSMSYAMKSVFPIFLLYFIQCDQAGIGPGASSPSPSSMPPAHITRSESRTTRANSPNRTRSKPERSSRPRKRNPEEPQEGSGAENGNLRSRPSSRRNRAEIKESSAGDRNRSRDRERSAPRRIESRQSSAPPRPRSSRRKQAAPADSKQAMVYKKPDDPKNFVHYFYQKQGEHYSKVLKQFRADYERRMQEVLNSANPNVKAKTTQFVMKIKEARQVVRPQENLGVNDVNFSDTVFKIFTGMDLDIKEDIVALCKYYEFTKNMVAHWNYRISHRQELDPDAVIEISIRMMGTTAAVAYPIVIKVAEYTIKLAERPKVPVKGVTPGGLTDRLHKFVDILTIQMGAIGVSCLATIMKLPMANKEETSTRSGRLAVETKHATNSIAWAVKAIFPILLLYYIQHEQAAY